MKWDRIVEFWKSLSPYGKTALVFITFLAFAFLTGFFFVVLYTATPGTTTVPDVRGMSFFDAYPVLKARKLEVILRTKYVEGERIGKVIDQSLPPGMTVKEGREIVVTVVRLKGTSKMPELRGRPLGYANAILRNMGLKIEKIIEVKTNLRRGTVIGQIPYPGEPVGSGDRVVLLISAGK